MTFRFGLFAPLVILLAIPETVMPVETTISMEVDDAQVKAWNRFANELYELHKKITAGREIRKSEETGRYGGDFAKRYSYREVSYYDEKSGRLLSVIRRDVEKPDDIQIVAVYIYDKSGRVIRDYSAIYLPWGRNAPIRTFINLHQYHDKLHGFRQFDASNNRLYEQCRGEIDGHKIEISLEDYQIEPPIVSSDAYRNCFGGLPESAGEYLTPH